MAKNRVKSVAVNFLLVSASILVAFLIAECVVRVFIPQDKKITWIEMHPEGFMMNQSGGYAFHELGRRNSDYYFTISRLRGTEEPDSTKLKVLTLGDSFTFGLHLNEEATYIYQLQQKSNTFRPDSIQFLNAAVGGTGLADWPGWLEEFGSDIHPDVVILFLNIHDVERALSKNLFVYEAGGDSLIASQRWAPRPFFTELSRAGWYRWLQAHSELMNIIVKLLWRFVYFEDLSHSFDPNRSTVPVPDQADFEIDSPYSLLLSKQIADRLNDWCRINNCKFIIATTGFFEDKVTGEHTARFYHWLNSSDSLSFPYFDITKCVMQNSSGNLSAIKIPGDSHPDETGAEIIANCSWPRLQSELQHP